MSRNCSECNQALHPCDPHPLCMIHSADCLELPFFDPRKCRFCQTLFNAAKVNEESYACWQTRLEELSKHPETPSLHPDAKEFSWLPDPRPGPSRDVNLRRTPTRSSDDDISRQTLSLLQRLEASLRE